MKTRIKKLIDEHVIQPLANALSTRTSQALEGGLKAIMEGLTKVKTAVNEQKQGVANEHARIDARIDDLTKKLEARADTHEDAELLDLASELRGVTSGLSQFHPATTEAPAGGDTSGNAGAEPTPATADTEPQS
jgi:uncharacterized phage infection (PIP) family protein YhgE